MTTSLPLPNGIRIARADSESQTVPSQEKTVSVNNQEKASPEWSTYPDPASVAADRTVHDHDQHTDPQGPHGASNHGGHRWMMLLMCLPLVAIGLWQFATGGGWGALRRVGVLWDDGGHAPGHGVLAPPLSAVPPCRVPCGPSLGVGAPSACRPPQGLGEGWS